MTRKLVTDMRVERFEAWRSLLSLDRALSHQAGILAVRPGSATFKAGTARNELPVTRDSDYRAMHAYADGRAFSYPYEVGIRPLTGHEVAVGPGRYACLLVFDDAVSLSALRPRVDELVEAQRQAATAPPAEQPAGLVLDAMPEISPEAQSGAA